MKTLGINGSPRSNGNSSKMVKTFLDGASKKGHKTIHLELGKMDIKPCKGCYGCQKSFSCVQNDDMEKIYSALSEADEVFFATPYYMMQISGQLKIVFDRLLPIFFKKCSGVDVSKKGYISFTQEGGTNSDYNNKYLEIVKTSMDEFGIELIDAFFSGENSTIDSVNSDTDLLNKISNIY